ncbi:hypothetical protein [Altericista sp. CCNU0014]|uniref:hypothetical protein n=1 Tax=Altericista sp. CCNU0014 TaxID=3082949 RepID=UPI00384F5C24
MQTLSWHDSILLVSCFASVAGLYFYGRSQAEDPTDAEAAHETLVRLSFVYWLVYCASNWGEQICASSSQGLACSLRVLGLFSYILTFSCVLSVPLHAIEQRRRQPN